MKRQLTKEDFYVLMMSTPFLGIFAVIFEVLKMNDIRWLIIHLVYFIFGVELIIYGVIFGLIKKDITIIALIHKNLFERKAVRENAGGIEAILAGFAFIVFGVGICLLALNSSPSLQVIMGVALTGAIILIAIFIVYLIKTSKLKTCLLNSLAVLGVIIALIFIFKSL